MGLSLPHIIILALVVLVLFGRGRISEMMGDFGKGIKSFKQGMAEEAEVKPMAPLLPASPLRNQYCSFADARSCSGVVLGKPKNSR